MSPRRAYLMRRARALAGDLGLTDEERRELAMMLPDQKGASGPVSWGQCTDDDLSVMVQWLHGARHVYDILSMRPFP